MPKDDLILLGHMLEMAQKALSKVQGKTREAFDQDENLRLALAHLLQIIGEAANHVSKEFQQSHPEIPWTDIIGFRHRVVYDYLRIDQDVIWQTSTSEMGPLIEMLKPLVPANEQNQD
jgi:uncharacterized protein with HEPN domain